MRKKRKLEVLTFLLGGKDPDKNQTSKAGQFEITKNFFLVYQVRHGFGKVVWSSSVSNVYVKQRKFKMFRQKNMTAKNFLKTSSANIYPGLAPWSTGKNEPIPFIDL